MKKSWRKRVISSIPLLCCIFSFEKLQSLSLSDLENNDGIGKITAQSIYSGLHDKFLYEPIFQAGVTIQPFFSEVIESKKTAISKKKIYITGSVQGYNKK